MKQDFILNSCEEGYYHVAYTEWGEFDSLESTVICVHGLTRNGRDFDALANYLSAHGHHVFCPDIIGRGDSSWLRDSNNYNFERYISDLNVLISRTEAKQVDWIGTSMGGIIGLMMAALPNTPIRRLILNDVGPQVPLHSLWEMAKYVGKEPEFTSKEQAKAHYKTIYAEFGNLTEHQWEEFTENSIHEQSPGLFISKYDPNIHEFKFKWNAVKDFFYHPHKALEGVFFDIDLWSYWQKLTCPVYAIRGSRSTLLLPEHLQKMQRSDSLLEVYEVADAGHAPALLEVEHHEKIHSWLRSGALI